MLGIPQPFVDIMIMPEHHTRTYGRRCVSSYTWSFFRTLLHTNWENFTSSLVFFSAFGSQKLSTFYRISVMEFQTGLIEFLTMNSRMNCIALLSFQTQRFQHHKLGFICHPSMIGGSRHLALYTVSPGRIIWIQNSASPILCSLACPTLGVQKLSSEHRSTWPVKN